MFARSNKSRKWSLELRSYSLRRFNAIEPAAATAGLASWLSWLVPQVLEMRTKLQPKMARERLTAAYVGIYTSKGTAGSRFLSKLQIAVRGWPSQLKGRSPITSWKPKAKKPLTLVHSNIPGLRIEFLTYGTKAFDRAYDDLDLASVDPQAPDVLALYEGPIARLELVLGMMARHAKDLGIGTLLILFPPPRARVRTTRSA
jgi:hypothetical protein